MKPALFLDRDGVINVEKNYLHRIDEFEFIDGVFDACRCFSELGFLIVVVTNQAGIARGYYSERDFVKLTDWMLKHFLEQGVNVAAVYHCPHHPEFSGECVCRKPNPGMFLKAQRELGIDLSHSILVGDKVSDIQAGNAAGVGLNVLVNSGHSLSEDDKLIASCVIDSIADYLRIVGHLKGCA